MTLAISGDALTIDDVIKVARQHQQVSLSHDSHVQANIHKSQRVVRHIVEQQQTVYGINTSFGGLANNIIAQDQIEFLQSNLVWGLNSGVGDALPGDSVRAGMLLRANALAKGFSGVRPELIHRFCDSLNHGITPIVHRYGSIGASGDLVPLAHIAGAILGYSDDFPVIHLGERIGAAQALAAVGLEPITLQAKEGLALVNGTSVLTGIAILAWHDTMRLFELIMHIHALILHAMEADMNAHAEFVQLARPHPGQVHVAEQLCTLLAGSDFVFQHHINKKEQMMAGRLVQDRYSMRCLPQFLGPIVESLQQMQSTLTIEANGANDNPLIGPDERVYHNGNFLGQHVSLCMDQLRMHIGMMAKHMDSQIAMVATAAFNRGLTASLSSPTATVPYGLNALQIAGNSIMPRLLHLGQPIAPMFPTHAETYNQNINSQGFNSANMARDSVHLLQDYLAIALIFAVQAVDLRTHLRTGSYSSNSYLPEQLKPVYRAVYDIVGRANDSSRPLVANNVEQRFSDWVALLANDLRSDSSRIFENMKSNTSQSDAVTA